VLRHYRKVYGSSIKARGKTTPAYNSPVLSDDDKQWITRLLEERIEKLETTLLTEFHKWASPVELRQRSHAAALRAHDAEMEAMSDRPKNLEGR